MIQLLYIKSTKDTMSDDFDQYLEDVEEDLYDFGQLARSYQVSDINAVMSDEDPLEETMGTLLDSELEDDYSDLDLDEPPDDDDDESDPELSWKQLISRVYRENRKKRLAIAKKNWIPENIQLTTQEEKPQIFINSTQEEPEIYEIKLATITLNAELPLYFNLKVIALHLKTNNYITSIKCEKVCVQGEQKAKPKPRKGQEDKEKKGRKDRNDFYNQCTLTICPYGDENIKINLKIFPNGKVSFTGVKKIEDAQLALEVLLDHIAQLSGPVIYLINDCEHGNTKNFRKKLKLKKKMLEYISQVTNYTADWEKFILSIKTKGKNNYPNGLTLPPEIGYGLAFLEIMTTYYPLEQVNRQEALDLSQLIQKSFKPLTTPFDSETELSILQEYIKAGEDSLDLNESTTLLPPARFLLHLPAWWPQPYLLGNHKIDDPKEIAKAPMFSQISITGLSPFKIRPDYYHPNMINISNINTTFNYNFVLRRHVLYDLLCNKYQQYDCSFEANYGGINLKYLSRVECPKHNDQTSIEQILPEFDGCRCKPVSILIFTNITLVTGARSFHQIEEAYDFIRNILVKEFVKILKINKNMPHPCDQFPNIISSDKLVYLKKKFIVDNPKNHFLLSRNEILHEYENY